jgi:hypothetical protein
MTGDSVDRKTLLKLGVGGSVGLGPICRGGPEAGEATQAPA